MVAPFGVFGLLAALLFVSTRQTCTHIYMYDACDPRKMYPPCAVASFGVFGLFCCPVVCIYNTHIYCIYTPKIYPPCAVASSMFFVLIAAMLFVLCWEWMRQQWALRSVFIVCKHARYARRVRPLRSIFWFLVFVYCHVVFVNNTHTHLQYICTHKIYPPCTVA